MSITLILGPMFASKSTTLGAYLEREYYSGKKCLLIKYEGDNRYGDAEDPLITHSGHIYNKFDVKALSCIKSAIIYMDDYDVFGIDEGQFFPDIHVHTEFLANYGKKVFVAALNSDANRDSFGRIHDLVAKAEKIITLSAICIDCRRKAHFTTKINNSITSHESNSGIDIEIGGADIYKPVCRQCYNKINEQLTN